MLEFELETLDRAAEAEEGDLDGDSGGVSRGTSANKDRESTGMIETDRQ